MKILPDFIKTEIIFESITSFLLLSTKIWHDYSATRGIAFSLMSPVVIVFFLFQCDQTIRFQNII
jgi:hypothetical protein